MKRFTLVAAISLVGLAAMTSCNLREVIITANPESGISPLTVDFEVRYNEGRRPNYCEWEFGDGSPVVSGGYDKSSVTHVFQSPGACTVICNVQVNDEFLHGSGQASIDIHVFDPDSIPAVTIDGTPLTYCPGGEPLYVTFTSSVSGGVPPYEYSWNFGDGGVSTEPNPVYPYDNTGSFQAFLEVTDSLGHVGVSNLLTVNHCN